MSSRSWQQCTQGTLTAINDIQKRKLLLPHEMIVQKDSKPFNLPTLLISLGLVGSIGLSVHLMSARGNQTDTGIMNEVYQLIEEKRAANVCNALDILMEEAKEAQDKQKQQRIKKTQKAKGCRHSRNR